MKAKAQRPGGKFLFYASIPWRMDRHRDVMGHRVPVVTGLPPAPSWPPCMALPPPESVTEHLRREALRSYVTGQRFLIMEAVALRWVRVRTYF